MSLVSVIIPTYNSSELLDRAINSVLQQILQPYEIIVVDDGSTDGTAKLMKKFSSKNIIYIIQEHLGTSAARNNGVKHATCSWIAFLDADDIWYPAKLKRQMDLLKSMPYADCLSCNCIKEKTGKPITPEGGKEFFIDGLDALANNIVCINSSVVVLKREYFLAIGGFDNDISYTEDADLLARYLYHFPRLGYLTNPLVIYCSNVRSVTHTKYEMSLEHVYFLFCKHRKMMLKSNDKRTRFFAKYIHERILNTLRSSLGRCHTTHQRQLIKTLQRNGMKIPLYLWILISIPFPILKCSRQCFEKYRNYTKKSSKHMKDIYNFSHDNTWSESSIGNSPSIQPM